jgi:hypothetical protein
MAVINRAITLPPTVFTISVIQQGKMQDNTALNFGKVSKLPCEILRYMIEVIDALKHFRSNLSDRLSHKRV